MSLCELTGTGRDCHVIMADTGATRFRNVFTGLDSGAQRTFQKSGRAR